MLVGQLLARIGSSVEAVSMSEEDSLSHAAHLLSLHRVGAVAVTDAAGRLRGRLAEHDVASRPVSPRSDRRS